MHGIGNTPEGPAVHGKPKLERVAPRETAACGEPMLWLRKRARGKEQQKKRMRNK